MTACFLRMPVARVLSRSGIIATSFFIVHLGYNRSEECTALSQGPQLSSASQPVVPVPGHALWGSTAMK